MKSLLFCRYGCVLAYRSFIWVAYTAICYVISQLDVAWGSGMCLLTRVAAGMPAHVILYGLFPSCPTPHPSLHTRSPLHRATTPTSVQCLGRPSPARAIKYELALDSCSVGENISVYRYDTFSCGCVVFAVIVIFFVQFSGKVNNNAFLACEINKGKSIVYCRYM